MEEKILDARNLKCPMPIIQIAKMSRGLEVGELIKVLANDPVFDLDVAAWCKQTKNELVSLEKNENDFIAIIKVCRL
jgi:tRNA 2-thiouridine synthesizing protein A